MINLEQEKRILFHKHSALDILDEEEEEDKEEISTPKGTTIINLISNRRGGYPVSPTAGERKKGKTPLNNPP